MQDESSSTELRERVRASAITQDRLAQALGIDRSWLSRILSGKQQMSAEFAARVERALDALETAEMAADERRREVLERAGLAS